MTSSRLPRNSEVIELFTHVYQVMPVDGYIILRDNAQRSPHLRSLTGPYLFRSEAEKWSSVIAAASKSICHVSVITVERLLSEPVKFDGQWTVTSVWNIRALSQGFEGSVMVDGSVRKVRRIDPDEPWRIVEGDVATAERAIATGPTRGRSEGA